MKYKISATNLENYETVKKLLPTSVRILVDIKKRFMLSVENIAPPLISKIQETGARVIEEYQYDLEKK